MLTFDETITGTLDEMQPLLEERGYHAALTMAGPIPLSDLDPYGMRRLGSVNIRTEQWASHIYRGVLAFDEGKAFLADAKRPTGNFVGGLYELVGVWVYDWQPARIMCAGDRQEAAKAYWDAFIRVMRSGKPFECDREMYEYWLGVLPPVFMGRTVAWPDGMKVRAHYGFAEGEEPICAFWEREGRFYGRMTDIVSRGLECFGGDE